MIVCVMCVNFGDEIILREEECKTQILGRHKNFYFN